MKDRDVIRTLEQGGIVKALLVNRGGWQGYMPAQPGHLTIVPAWNPMEGDDYIIWKVSVVAQGGQIVQDLYLPAENILGISIQRGDHALSASPSLPIDPDRPF